MPTQYNNVNEVSLALAVWLAHDSYDYCDDPNTISVTTLLRPIRQIVLAPRIPPGEGLPDLGSMLKSRLGTAIHDGIERAWFNNYKSAMRALGISEQVIDRIIINPSKECLENEPKGIPIYLEQRLTRKHGKWTITGKIDFIGQGKVQDFKSTTVWAYMNQAGSVKYVEQGSLYRWLDPEIITQDQMQIHYIFTDWKGSFVKTDPKYPTKSFYTQNFDLLSEQATEFLVNKKLALIDKYWDAPEEDIPYCTDEELWRSKPQFKYYKNGDINAARSTKNFDTNQDAVIHMTTKGGGAGAIREVPGQVTACKYCPVFAMCSQKDALITSGELVI